MKNKFHGIFSILLLGITIAIGLYQVVVYSVIMGLIYLAIILVSWPVMIYAYCSKCQIRQTGCRHVFVGKLTRFFPARKNAPYTMLDYLGLGIPLVALMAFPQYWLWKNPLLWGIFSILPLVSVLDLLLYVCRGCENTNCQICVRRNKIMIT